MFFGNISKNTHFLVLIISRPPRRVLKTFSEKKSIFFLFVKNLEQLFFFNVFFAFFRSVVVLGPVNRSSQVRVLLMEFFLIIQNVVVQLVGTR